MIEPQRYRLMLRTQTRAVINTAADARIRLAMGEVVSIAGIGRQMKWEAMPAAALRNGRVKRKSVTLLEVEFNSREKRRRR